MYNLDTKEEVDFDWFLEALENNEIQLVSPKWTEEEWKQLSRDLAICKEIHRKKLATEAVLA
jgi:hypothetical protein